MLLTNEDIRDGERRYLPFLVNFFLFFFSFYSFVSPALMANKTTYEWHSQRGPFAPPPAQEESLPSSLPR